MRARDPKHGCRTLNSRTYEVWLLKLTHRVGHGLICQHSMPALITKFYRYRQQNYIINILLQTTIRRMFSAAFGTPFGPNILPLHKTICLDYMASLINDYYVVYGDRRIEIIMVVYNIRLQKQSNVYNACIPATGIIRYANNF